MRDLTHKICHRDGIKIPFLSRSRPCYRSYASGCLAGKSLQTSSIAVTFSATLAGVVPHAVATPSPTPIPNPTDSVLTKCREIVAIHQNRSKEALPISSEEISGQDFAISRLARVACTFWAGLNWAGVFAAILQGIGSLVRELACDIPSQSRSLCRSQLLNKGAFVACSSLLERVVLFLPSYSA